jgi:hypothetical protein
MTKDKLQLDKAITGRPSKYSEELADEICLRLSFGEGLVKICKLDHMPARSTVMLWLLKMPGFSDKYALAREAQADYLLEELIDIADDKENDTYEDAKGNIRVDHENVNRSRLRVDTRKWVISKLAPKKYGDRVDLATTDHNWTVNGIPIKT